jgi:hypothetical protein
MSDYFVSSNFTHDSVSIHRFNRVGVSHLKRELILVKYSWKLTGHSINLVKITKILVVIIFLFACIFNNRN